MTSIIRYTPASTLSPLAAPSEFVTAALDVLRVASNLKTRPRALQQFTARLEAAHVATGHIERIQQVVIRVTRESETCARDVSRFRADIAEHDLRRDVAEFQSDQLAQERALLPTRTQERDELAELQHRIAKARLQAELDEIEHSRPSNPTTASVASTTPNLDAERATMDRERALTDARRIVEDITAEHVPTDARQPYHAFAGCLYLAARLDGLSAADAAAHTRGVVADRITSGANVTLDDRIAFKLRYDELKTRLDGAAQKRDGAFMLDALHHLGNGNGSQRPS
jgi:hypothetical protein